MSIRRRTNNNGIECHFIEHLSRILEAFNSKGFRSARHCFLVRISNRNQFCERFFYQTLKVYLADPAATDKTEPECRFRGTHCAPTSAPTEAWSRSAMYST